MKSSSPSSQAGKRGSRYVSPILNLGHDFLDRLRSIAPDESEPSPTTPKSVSMKETLQANKGLAVSTEDGSSLKVQKNQRFHL